MSIVAVAGGAVLGGFTLYLTGRKELAEHQKEIEKARADDEQVRLAKQIRSQAGILATINAVAYAQNRIIDSAAPAVRLELVGRFKQIVVEGIRSIVILLQAAEDGEAAVRVMFCESPDGRSVVIDGGQWAAEQGPALGQWAMSELKFSPDDPFVAAVNAFLMSGDEYVAADTGTAINPNSARLRSPDVPNHWLRMRVCCKGRLFGVLCIDVWGSRLLPRADIEPILAVGRILAAGLSGIVV